MSAVVIAVALLVAAGLIVGATDLGNNVVNPSRPAAQLGSFAGYIGYVQVTQISASWRVPAIEGSSQDGSASTWIGVQGPGQQEFFQVGTTETDEDGADFYEAFWSDPAQGFHAQVLMQVSAGDEIEAVISDQSGTWQASVDDVTSNETQSAPTTSGVFSNLQLAEWIQEDPSLPHNQHVPYPSIGPTTISALQVNGGTPDVSQLQAQVMVLPRGRRVQPGPVVNDQFSTRETTAT